MSVLNRVLIREFRFCLLCAPLALAALLGCSEEVEYEMPEYDFVNPAVCFFVSDAATGGNLLDPDAANTILGQPIAVTYDGKRCEVTAGADALSHTRANPPRSLALRLEGANECDGIEGYHLTFGEFDPMRDLKKQRCECEFSTAVSFVSIRM